MSDWTLALQMERERQARIRRKQQAYNVYGAGATEALRTQTHNTQEEE